MKLNHLNLCVNDLSEARDFFRDQFNFELLDQKGDAIAVMSDGDGFTLVLSKLRADGEEVQTYPRDFHLGFYVETPAEVDQFYHRLVTAGIATDGGPKKIRDGYTLYFTALGGILFEMTCFIR
ncbi:glyoxalase [Gordoniibacillus kamchatkensis]|uniref:Glyoxalase n=1 Tax=Gordoniibacillus kamchatkensis TaxID=1590651 RepID=A0ABR5AF25_9BACL|nr:VOC family protein [Paenibacillus sp. VKM B-2647]KIL39273.1 glyoxalase [Paenibacillus sp. VKM B-2647]